MITGRGNSFAISSYINFKDFTFIFADTVGEGRKFFMNNCLCNLFDNNNCLWIIVIAVIVLCCCCG